MRRVYAILAVYFYGRRPLGAVQLMGRQIGLSIESPSARVTQMAFTYTRNQ